jgi:predicted outer membrane lipoprotein
MMKIFPGILGILLMANVAAINALEITQGGMKIPAKKID